MIGERAGPARRAAAGRSDLLRVISTTREALFGTCEYRAPEQWVESKDVDPAVDVYALGAVLYESLTGQPPFDGDTPIEILRRVRETLSADGGDVPADVPGLHRGKLSGSTGLVVPVRDADGQLIASAGSSRFELNPERPSPQLLRQVRSDRVVSHIEGLDDTAEAGAAGAVVALGQVGVAADVAAVAADDEDDGVLGPRVAQAAHDAAVDPGQPAGLEGEHVVVDLQLDAPPVDEVQLLLLVVEVRTGLVAGRQDDRVHPEGLDPECGADLAKPPALPQVVQAGGGPAVAGPDVGPVAHCALSRSVRSACAAPRYTWRGLLSSGAW